MMVDRAMPLDEQDPSKPSTHARIEVYTERGVLVTENVARIDDLEEAVEYFKSYPGIGVIQVHIQRKTLLGEVACGVNSGGRHYVWDFQLVTHERSREGGWRVFDSQKIHRRCAYLVSPAETFETLRDRIRQQHEAQNSFLSSLPFVAGDPKPPEEGGLN